MPTRAIGALPNLTVAYLSEMGFNGSIPEGVAVAGNKLVGLDLRNNSLTGNVPGSIGRLAMLSSLDLRYNSITGVEAALCNGSNMSTATVLVRGGDCELRENDLRCANLPWCVREPYSKCYAECLPPGPSPIGQRYKCEGRLFKRQCVEDADGPYATATACKQAC